MPVASSAPVPRKEAEAQAPPPSEAPEHVAPPPSEAPEHVTQYRGFKLVMCKQKGRASSIIIRFVLPGGKQFLHCSIVQSRGCLAKLWELAVSIARDLDFKPDTIRADKAGLQELRSDHIVRLGF